MQRNYSLTHFNYYISFIIGVPLGLFLDSVWLSKYLNVYVSPYLWQMILSLYAIRKFYKHYKISNNRIKSFLIYALFVGLSLEIIASLILGIYIYRLENIPIYVPFGHSIIYITAFYLSKEPNLKFIKNKFELYSIILISIYCFMWLIFANDYFGFFCYIIFITSFYFTKRSRLFMLSIFYLVVYVELIGTYFGSWYWVEHNVLGFHSANPPSAIAVAYLLLDIVCLFLYKSFKPKIWNRFKSLNKK